MIAASGTVELSGVATRGVDEATKERALEADSKTSAEADSHRRRADKSQYLREKLEQRAQAERRAAREDD